MSFLLSNFKLLYNKNKLVFIIISVIQVIIVCTLLYTIVKIQSKDYYISDYNEDICTFTLIKDALTAKQASESISHLDISEIKAVKMFIGDSDDYKTVAYAIGEQESVMEQVNSFALNDFDYNAWKDSDEILLSIYNSFNVMDYPETIKIYDNDYRVIAVTDSYLSKYSIIPLKSALENDLPIKEVQIQYKNISGKSDMDKKNVEIFVAFAGGEVNNPIERNYAKEEGMANDEILSVILVFLSIISEMFFYIYILKKCVRDYAVYELCGARKGRVLLINYSILAIYFLFQYVIGYILFSTLILKIISKTEPILSAIINNRCYLYAFVILAVAFSVVFMIIMNTISKYQLRDIVKEK